jgi:spore maturation protein SpmA
MLEDRSGLFCLRSSNNPKPKPDANRYGVKNAAKGGPIKGMEAMRRVNRAPTISPKVAILNLDMSMIAISRIFLPIFSAVFPTVIENFDNLKRITFISADTSSSSQRM